MMKKSKYIKYIVIVLFDFFSFQFLSTAQAIYKLNNAHDFPELIFTDIKGAPKLQKPVLIMGDTKPVMGEGNGWAAPAMWDWNGDGKKDLLIGEFCSGKEVNRLMGNFIRVYENTGKDDAPKFTDDFSYARGIYDERSDGIPLSVRQFCCMPFTPQFYDLNGDGIQDLYTGNFFGEVTWFRGSERGFEKGEQLKQEGYLTDKQRRDSAIFYAAHRSKVSENDPGSSSYWNYSAVSFGEFTNDGLPDMIVGGYYGLKLSKNIGTKHEPKFGLRKLLLDINNQPLSDVKGIPYVVDWDKDGTLDLLVAGFYGKPGDIAVNFFRGVKIKNEYRFENAIPLFVAKDNVKAFPGDHLNITVTDWNNDGVNDLLVGTKVVTLNGVFDPKLSWTWIEDTGLGKFPNNPGYYTPNFKQEINRRIKNAEKLEAEIGKEEMERRRTGRIRSGENVTTNMSKEYIIRMYYGKIEYETLIQKGYVYLMLGEKML